MPPASPFSLLRVVKGTQLRTRPWPPRQRPLSQALWRITSGLGIPSLASVLQRTCCLSRGRTRQLCGTLITIIIIIIIEIRCAYIM